MDKLLAIGVFLIAYVLIIAFFEKRLFAVWGAAVALVLLGVQSPSESLAAINWNVILLFFGMRFIGEVFLYSKMPDYLATKLASRTSNTVLAMLGICAFTGALSTMLDNVTVLLLVSPIAISLSKKCNINPVPLFIGMAISSNLQGTATLIGDPPSMLLGSFAQLSFNDFFILNGKPGIFFAVQVGAIASLVVLHFAFRKMRQPMPKLEAASYVSLVPTVIVMILITCLAASSSLRGPGEEAGKVLQFVYGARAGILCCIFGAIALGWYLRHSKRSDIKEFFGMLDWQTGAFLMGIFVLVNSLTVTGIIGDIAGMLVQITGTNVLLAYVIIVGMSVMFSAVIDNIPYLVAMLPVVKIMTEEIGVSPYLFYFGLLIGASIGGNVTPVGASANIVAMGIMKKQGHQVRFMQFVKIGLPFTLVATAASAAVVWFFHK
ncbi:MAG TPA: SLC13 family permease [Sedimentisphaerales bacterium]|nr:SLC13 family permease [Sedimentisphaerales bacterium]